MLVVRQCHCWACWQSSILRHTERGVLWPQGRVTFNYLALNKRIEQVCCYFIFLQVDNNDSSSRLRETWPVDVVLAGRHHAHVGHRQDLLADVLPGRVGAGCRHRRRGLVHAQEFTWIHTHTPHKQKLLHEIKYSIFPSGYWIKCNSRWIC